MRDKLEFIKRPWAITEEAFEILSGYDLDRCEQSPALAEISADSYIERLNIDEDNGIATLDISGTLMPDPSLGARFFMGAVDSVRIESLVRDAAASDSVRALVIKINSAGGTVAGTPEIYNAVAACRAVKPVFAYSHSLVASAAYWASAPATGLIGTESSRWGSVGVIRPHVDLTKAREKAGIKVELFTSGKHKGAGGMSTSLDGDQRKAIQGEIEKLGEKFRASVSAYRDIERKDLEALVYYAGESVNNGYIDRIVSNYDEALEYVVSTLESGKYKQRKTADQEGADAVSLITGGAAVAVDIASEAESDGEKAENTMPNRTDNTNDDNAAEGSDAEANLEGGADVGDDQAQGGIAEGSQDNANESDDDPTTEARIATLESGQASVNNKLDQVLAALTKDKDDAGADANNSESDTASIEAARIAAESGVSAADVTGSGDAEAEADEHANMTAAELWGKYEAVLEEKGQIEASAFYDEHIAGN